MSSLDTLNVGGIDFDIEDSTSRVNSTSALNITAYKEDGDTASQAYAVIGTPINWKGTLYYTSATIASGDTLAVGTNLVSAANIGQMLTNIKTYVGSDSKLHFVDATGADSVLPFSSGVDLTSSSYAGASSGRGDNSISCSHSVSGTGIYISCAGCTGWSAGVSGTPSITLTGSYTTLASLAGGQGRFVIFSLASGSCTITAKHTNAHNYPSITLTTIKVSDSV